MKLLVSSNSGRLQVGDEEASDTMTQGLPEGIESAGHHGHLGALLNPIDGVRGDGGDASLVCLGVGHTEVVHTLDIFNPTKLYPDLAHTC